LAFQVPLGYEMQIRPRSGLAIKEGITVINSPGTLDNDYRGELMIGLINHGDWEFEVENGMRIAQIVIAPVSRMFVFETDKLGETDRGEGGLGSTGVK
jgi:dUTP pyrophosphatase